MLNMSVEASNVPVHYSELWLYNHQFVMNSCALLFKVLFSSLNDIFFITWSFLQKHNLVFMALNTTYLCIYILSNTSKHM